MLSRVVSTFLVSAALVGPALAAIPGWGRWESFSFLARVSQMEPNGFYAVTSAGSKVLVTQDQRVLLNGLRILPSTLSPGMNIQVVIPGGQGLVGKPINNLVVLSTDQGRVMVPYDSFLMAYQPSNTAATAPVRIAETTPARVYSGLPSPVYDPEPAQFYGGAAYGGYDYSYGAVGDPYQNTLPFAYGGPAALGLSLPIGDALLSAAIPFGPTYYVAPTYLETYAPAYDPGIYLAEAAITRDLDISLSLLQPAGYYAAPRPPAYVNNYFAYNVVNAACYAPGSWRSNDLATPWPHSNPGRKFHYFREVGGRSAGLQASNSQPLYQPWFGSQRFPRGSYAFDPTGRNVPVFRPRPRALAQPRAAFQPTQAYHSAYHQPRATFLPTHALHSAYQQPRASFQPTRPGYHQPRAGYQLPAFQQPRPSFRPVQSFHPRAPGFSPPQPGYHQTRPSFQPPRQNFPAPVLQQRHSPSAPVQAQQPGSHGGQSRHQHGR